MFVLCSVEETETHMIETETWYQEVRSLNTCHQPELVCTVGAQCNDIIIVTNNALTAEAPGFWIINK